MPWTKDIVTEKIIKRQVKGLPLNYTAVVASDEPLTGAARRLFGNWEEAIKAAGLDYDKIKRPKTDKLPKGYWTEELIVSMIRERETEDKELNPHQVQIENSKLYAAAVQKFNSWEKAIEAAGLNYSQIRKTDEWSKERVIERILYCDQRGADLSDNTVAVLAPDLYGAASTHFGSWANAVKASGIDYNDVRRTDKWDKDKVIDYLQGMATNGIVPSSANAVGGLHKAIIQHFDSWDEARRIAGVDLDYNNPGNVVCHARQYRQAKGLSLEAVGKQIGYSHRALSLIELNQQVDPRISYCLKLSKALGVSVEELFKLIE